MTDRTRKLDARCDMLKELLAQHLCDSAISHNEEIDDAATAIDR
ncbi:hypothetical protein [Tardiphaga robiniae]|nr:hypothetical protein [Tardiphaga robiniae]